MSTTGTQGVIKKKPLSILLGVSTRMIELMVKDGRLPKPIYLGDSSPRWRQCDIDAWLEKLATEAQANIEVAS